MDKPPSIPEKNPKIDVIGLSYLISILFILKPKKLTNAAKIIDLSEDIANQIKFPNSTYKLNFGVRINNKINTIWE